MGLGEWWLTKGPGSPGSVARAMANAYVQIKNANPGMSKLELLAATLVSRYQLPGTLPEPEAFRMLRDSEGHLARLTVQVWEHEAPTARGAMLNAPDVYRLAVQIIERETRKIAGAV